MLPIAGLMVPRIIAPTHANMPSIFSKPQNTLVAGLIDNKPHTHYMTFSDDVSTTQLVQLDALIEGKHSTWDFFQICPTDFDYEMIKEWVIQQAVTESLAWMWNNGVIAMFLIWILTLVVCVRLLDNK